MRSFKSKVLSACVWAVPVLTAALPTLDRREVPQPQGSLLHYDLHQDYAQATFSVPCSGCLGSSDDTDQHDESLVLSFKSHVQEQPCGSSNITLNGLDLPQEWTGDFASGSGSYTGVDLYQNERSLDRALDLEWTSACIHATKTDEAAQLLTVSIKAIDGKALVPSPGFTVSFKQHTSPPSLLRLAFAPDPSASDEEAAQDWLGPPTHLRLDHNVHVTDSDDAETTPEQSLEADYRELRALQLELRELQLAIAAKKNYINSQITKNIKTLTEEVNECESIACIIKSIARKARGAWRIAVVRFHTHQQHSEDMGRPEDLDAYAQAHGHVPQWSGGHLKADTSVTSVTPGSQVEETPTKETKEPNELPPRPPKPSPYVIALEVTLSLLCCGCLVAVIRHKCSSLRTRTDRAAAREERANARAFRRAARRHAWRNWWRGNWRKDQERIADYEEKRALIQDQEDVLEDAMQEEIRQLRAAHDVVNDLVRDAEEGRVIGHTPCHCHHTSHVVPPYSPSVTSTYPPTSLPDIPSRPMSRTDSLPSYRSDPPSEPPNYDSEVDMSGIVANGFRRYRSSTTSQVSETSETTSHWTPDSSVVDVSPRPSAETLRYPRSILTCEEESDED